MRATGFVLPCIAVAAAVAIGACSGEGGGPTGNSPFDTSFLASCGTSNAFFTALPFDAAQIGGWVPLGNLNPPAHTFPTDHQYIYLAGWSSGTAQPASLYVPGDATIFSAKS